MSEPALSYREAVSFNRRMEKNSFNATWMATLPAAVQTFLGGRNGKGDVYAYDMAYRLVDARYDVTNPLAEVASPGTQPFVNRVQYTIDGLGNRSQTQAWPPTPPTGVLYSADVVNQYTSVGGVTRSHDNNGNLTDDGTYLFGYDFQNRLVELKNKSTSLVIATYRYDALGRRVEKAVVGGATTRYILDGVQVVEEYDGANTWQARYVYEDGIDQPRCMDRADIADVNGNANTTEVLRFHYHQQALGSVTEITQPTGAVVEWVTYDVYGQPTIRDKGGTVITQSAVGNPYLYTGREFDPESGLFFYRARTYDPAAGRFLQRDPLGYVDGLCHYAYARHAPSTHDDPLGLLAASGKGRLRSFLLLRGARPRSEGVESRIAVAGSTCGTVTGFAARVPWNSPVHFGILDDILELLGIKKKDPVLTGGPVHRGPRIPFTPPRLPLPRPQAPVNPMTPARPSGATQGPAGAQPPPSWPPIGPQPQLPLAGPLPSIEKMLEEMIFEKAVPLLGPDNWGRLAGRRGFDIFKGWYHRQYKKQGDPDASPDELGELWDEWDKQGRPNAEGTRTEPRDSD